MGCAYTPEITRTAILGSISRARCSTASVICLLQAGWVIIVRTKAGFTLESGKFKRLC